MPPREILETDISETESESIFSNLLFKYEYHIIFRFVTHDR